MVADSSSHDSATTENDGDGEILGETQGKPRDATWPVGVYILLLVTERVNCEREFFYLIGLRLRSGYCRRLQGHSHVVVGGLHL